MMSIFLTVIRNCWHFYLFFSVAFISIPNRVFATEVNKKFSIPKGNILDYRSALVLSSRLRCLSLFEAPSMQTSRKRIEVIQKLAVQGKLVESDPDVQVLTDEMKNWRDNYLNENSQPLLPNGLSLQVWAPSFLNAKISNQLTTKSYPSRIWVGAEAPQPGIVFSRLKFYEGTHSVRVEETYSSLAAREKSETSLVSESKRTIGTMIQSEFERKYSQEEIAREIAIEEQLEAQRTILVSYSTIGTTASAETPVFSLRLYDASPVYDLADPTHPNSRTAWKENMSDSRLPMQMVYPKLKLNCKYCMQIGRAAKNHAVDSIFPALRWLASSVKNLYQISVSNDGRPVIHPELYIFITAKPAQATLYQQEHIGFKKPPPDLVEKNLNELPEYETDETVLYMTGQEFIDRFINETSRNFEDYPWLRRPVAPNNKPN